MRTLEENSEPPGSSGSTTMRFISSFFLICLFLWLGLQLRRMKIFRIFSLPASITGGFIGLLFVQLCKRNSDVYDLIVYDWIAGWSALPGILINVVFATLFLGKKLPTFKQAWRDGGPQVMYGQLIAWGNWSISCLISGAILIPAFGVSPLFASMYAVGFEGGHGTAAGLADTYTALGEPTYGDIALTAATIGILMGSIFGVTLVNWGIATGRVAMHQDGTIHPIDEKDVEAASPKVVGVDSPKASQTEVEVKTSAAGSPTEESEQAAGADRVPPEQAEEEPAKNETAGAGEEEEEEEDSQGKRKKRANLCRLMFGDRDVPDDIYALAERPPGGKQTVRQDAVESLALHLIYVAFSCFFGYSILRLLWLIEYNVPELEEIKFFTSFPLFPWCMIGGLFCMFVHEKTGSEAPVDALVMERIGGAAMEFLIVSAIAVINTDAVAENIAPLIIIMLGGMLWNFFLFFYVAKRVLPNFTFERAIVELGQSFGTTSTGLLLLRMCDPEKETPVWSAFGYKQMMTEPFMGGGIWTTVSLQLLAIIGVWGVFGIASGFVIFWTLMYFFYFKKMYAKAAAEEDLDSQESQGIETSVLVTVQ